MEDILFSLAGDLYRLAYYVLNTVANKARKGTFSDASVTMSNGSDENNNCTIQNLMK